MKHSEAEILAIAKNVMEQVGWTYDPDRIPVAVFNSKNSYYEQYQNLKGFDQIKDKIRADWVVSFGFPPEEEVGHNTMFLEIDDETGEPNELRHKQAKFKFVKKTGSGWELLQTFGL